MANINFNKVIIGGRITADPELKQTPQGVSVTTFSIAVNRKGKDAQADFINCVAWRQTAELICKYFNKGNSIIVEGTLQTRSWQDQQGNKRTATEVIAETFHFVESKLDNEPDAASLPKVDAPKFEEVGQDDDLPF